MCIESEEYKNIENLIEERDYTKQELADLFFPNTKRPEARIKALWREVNGCSELVEALRRLRWNPRSHSYTKRQIEVMKELLCRD